MAPVLAEAGGQRINTRAISTALTLVLVLVVFLGFCVLRRALHLAIREQVQVRPKSRANAYNSVRSAQNDLTAATMSVICFVAIFSTRPVQPRAAPRRIGTQCSFAPGVVGAQNLLYGDHLAACISLKSCSITHRGGNSYEFRWCSDTCRTCPTLSWKPQQRNPFSLIGQVTLHSPKKDNLCKVWGVCKQAVVGVRCAVGGRSGRDESCVTRGASSGLGLRKSVLSPALKALRLWLHQWST
ncbi:hypothetical protein B0T26DRAFT_496373 [Lasiosphaeria miniovina]|uniref:Uncharacterized protein n=1 Tax=Lasiosphaeria miniovina TaxID=1954250 RepID=A0AA40DH68_9PEZI|nr:uncharacterized protein B0T26DRAFT_496373 [Lasiosphaeria miniovina]KAK0703384.1 hypothetical protein B0T26DRAFT_496373 [Lasiosphaeria miniovina]